MAETPKSHNPTAKSPGSRQKLNRIAGTSSDPPTPSHIEGTSDSTKILFPTIPTWLIHSPIRHLLINTLTLYALQIHFPYLSILFQVFTTPRFLTSELATSKIPRTLASTRLPYKGIHILMRTHQWKMWVHQIRYLGHRVPETTIRNALFRETNINSNHIFQLHTHTKTNG